MSDVMTTLEVTRVETTAETTLLDAETQTAEVDGTRLVRVKFHAEIEGHPSIKKGDSLLFQVTHMPQVEKSDEREEGNGLQGGGGVGEPPGPSVDGESGRDHRVGSQEGVAGGEKSKPEPEQGEGSEDVLTSAQNASAV